MGIKLYSRLALALLLVGFLVFTALNNLLFGGVRLDLTEHGLYTISDGTRRILDSIGEPINLQLFFSDEAAKDVAPLRIYASRVRELLEELELQAGGRLRLSVVDPAPFSESEDQAAAFGLQSVPLSLGGDAVYFGLAGTNAYGDENVIAFLQPDREQYLEYEIAELIQSLVSVQKPVIGLLSGLQINGGFDMASQRPTPAWMVIEQARELFELREIQASAESIEKDVTLLMLVHPGELSEKMEFAIDQFVLNGGHALIFVDPFCESANVGANPMMRQAPANTASNLPRLFKAWGVEMTEGKVLADRANALLITAVPGEAPVPHLAFLALGGEAIVDGDIVSEGLEAVNVGAAGILRPIEGASTKFVPLLQSSDQAALLDTLQVQISRDPRSLLEGFQPTGERYTVAARLSGAASSAFDGAIEEGGDYQSKSDNINVIVVTDADMLADRFWVQTQDFFGQRIATAWADNGTMVLNAMENLAGSSDLISIRSRGRYSRPFTVVQQLRAEAEARNRATADGLQQRLDETERQLTELQKSKQDQNLLVLSDEQEAALSQFQQEKLRIRKELRDVRHQLDKDIQNLGTALKLLNIVVLPLMLTALLWLLHRSLRRHRAWRTR